MDLEWREFQHTDLPECSSESFPVDKFWKKIGDMKKVDGTLKFFVLSELMKSLLVLPHSSADAERVFSQLTLIKTKQRNRIGNDLLNSLLTVKCNMCTTCYNFEPSEAMLDLACSSDVLYTSDSSSDPFDDFMEH